MHSCHSPKLSATQFDLKSMRLLDISHIPTVNIGFWFIAREY